MTVQEATKIVEKYCAEISENRKAVYCGEFEGGFLYSLDFQGGGHHGMPIFTIVSTNGVIKKVESHSEDYYKAWNASDNYLDSISL